MLTPDTVRSLLANNDFLAFKDHLEDCLQSLNTVTGLSELSNEHAGEEAKVRLRSAQVIAAILHPLEVSVEKKQLDVEKLIAAHKRAGLA